MLGMRRLGMLICDAYLQLPRHLLSHHPDRPSYHSGRFLPTNQIHREKCEISMDIPMLSFPQSFESLSLSLSLSPPILLSRTKSTSSCFQNTCRALASALSALSLTVRLHLQSSSAQPGLLIQNTLPRSAAVREASRRT